MPDEQVGQLIWAFISSDGDLPSVERAARAGHLAGVWLLPTQMPNPAETVTLINRLQAAATTPLLIGVDAEAGMGLVMGGATHLPTAMALGAADDPAIVAEAAALTATEARACGINLVAAPVLDVNINPDNPIINTRSFGGDPRKVGELGAAFIKGLQGPASEHSAVLAIGKHFPGHGDTVSDSHLQLGTVDQPRARLDAVELPPFRAAIEAGTAMLMTAHVAYPALDPAPGTPATLSHPIMTDLLRHEMGFQGALATDCMNMHAVSHNFEAGEAAVRAVLAGCDLVLTDQWDRAYEALLAAASTGTLSAARLEEAAGRVLAIKARIFDPNLTKPKPIDPTQARMAVGTAEHTALARRIAAASITLVQGELTPCGERPLIIATRMARRFGPSVESQLRAALAEIGWDTADVLIVDPTPDAQQVGKAVHMARTARWATLLHFNQVASFDPEAVLVSSELVELAQRITEAGVPLAVASLGSPYVLPRFSHSGALLCSYSTCGASLRALLQVLSGAATAPGRLPVALTR